MAIFHFNVQVLSRAQGDNGVAAAAYRAGQRLTCERTGAVFNYTRKREVAHREIRAPQSVPRWTFEREKLWNEVERSETRSNSQLARDVEVALPVELTREQQVALLRDYIDEQFICAGMVADFALHAKPGNPHAHILLTLRELTPDGFQSKRRDWNDRAHVTTWREQWATHCNRALASAGIETRIDHRSLVAQGSDLLPTKHVGRQTLANRLDHEERLSWNAFITARNELRRIQAEERNIRAQVSALTSEIIDLETSLAHALAQRPIPHPAGQTFVVVGERPGITGGGVAPLFFDVASIGQHPQFTKETHHVASATHLSDSSVLPSADPHPTRTASR